MEQDPSLGEIFVIGGTVKPPQSPHSSERVGHLDHSAHSIIIGSNWELAHSCCMLPWCPYLLT